MATAQNRIKLQSLEFTESPFRKLRSLKVEFAERLTVIAGHNGIGKSTILGLVANTFGLTASGDVKTYTGDPFYANIERIVYLALAEVEVAQQQPSDAPVVSADVFGEAIRKRCAMTKPYSRAFDTDAQRRSFASLRSFPPVAGQLRR